MAAAALELEEPLRSALAVFEDDPPPKPLLGYQVLHSGLWWLVCDAKGVQIESFRLLPDALACRDQLEAAR